MKAGSLAPARVPRFQILSGGPVFDNLFDSLTDSFLARKIKCVERSKMGWYRPHRDIGRPSNDGTKGRHLRPCVYDHVYCWRGGTLTQRRRVDQNFFPLAY